jgi:hypothetical protein
MAEILPQPVGKNRDISHLVIQSGSGTIVRQGFVAVQPGLPLTNLRSIPHPELLTVSRSAWTG